MLGVADVKILKMNRIRFVIGHSDLLVMKHS